MYRATSKHKKKQAMFFRVKPANVKNTNLTIHNLSTFKLTTPDAQLLSRGLSFVPTPKVTPEKMHVDLLRSYDKFARSLRVQYINQEKNSNKKDTTQTMLNTSTPSSVQVYRPMKFLTKPRYITPNEIDSGIGQLENYIETTRRATTTNM